MKRFLEEKTNINLEVLKSIENAIDKYLIGDISQMEILKKYNLLEGNKLICFKAIFEEIKYFSKLSDENLKNRMFFLINQENPINYVKNIYGTIKDIMIKENQSFGNNFKRFNELLPTIMEDYINNQTINLKEFFDAVMENQYVLEAIEKISKLDFTVNVEKLKENYNLQNIQDLFELKEKIQNNLNLLSNLNFEDIKLEKINFLEIYI